MNPPSDRKLTREELRAWLDRKPPPRHEPAESYEDEPLVCLVHGTARCAHDQSPDERPWEEFEKQREYDEQLEAGHA